MALLRSYSSFRLAAFLLFTALLIWIEVTITQTAAFIRQPIVLSFCLMFDLVFVTTGLFYWFVARPFHLANSRLFLIALLMLRVSLFILPKASFLPNQLWPLLLVLIEAIVLIMAGLRIRIIVGVYRSLRPMTDAETAMRGGLATVFGERMAGAILGEALTLYYVILGWRLRSDIPTGGTTLTTHRQSGQIALLVGLLLIALIESVVVHLLLHRWSPTSAFWVTAFSVYGMLFFVADAIAAVKQPSYLTDNQLHIRLGVRWWATVSRSVIVCVALLQDTPDRQTGLLNGAFLTTPNVLLTFSESVTFRGPYGLRRQVTRFAFFVDDRSEFVQQLMKN